VSLADEGQYVCRASNEGGHTEQRAQLFIQSSSQRKISVDHVQTKQDYSISYVRGGELMGFTLTPLRYSPSLSNLGYQRSPFLVLSYVSDC